MAQTTKTLSMTGFGQADGESDFGKVAVEMKSVNHRYLDLRVSLPRGLSWMELGLARHARERLGRGKVDVSVNWVPSVEWIPRLIFNVELLRFYQAELASAAMPLRREDQVSFEYLLALPGVTEKETPDYDGDALQAFFEEVLDKALDILLAEKQREGAVLAGELRSRLENLERCRQTVESRASEVVEVYRAKLLKKAEEWAKSVSIDVDAGRLEAEVLLYADRSDITEELVRLGAHIEAFGKTLDGDGGEVQGKSMDFLAQELLRETNTIASKSRDTSIASEVIVMKNEIEKIREQALNVE